MNTVKSNKRIYWFDSINRYGTIEDDLQLQVKDNIEVKIFGDINEWIDYAATKEIIIDINDYLTWHDNTKQIQILQKHEDCIEMLDNYPEIGVYRKEEEIESFREYSFVYVYVNYILEEHRILLENYNAIITEK